MKVIINQRGQLLVIPETFLEVYALKGWCQKNFEEGECKGEICFLLETLDKDGKMNISADIRIGEVREST